MKDEGSRGPARTDSPNSRVAESSQPLHITPLGGNPASPNQMLVVLFYAGLNRPGGITPDLLLLATQLETQKVDVRIAPRLRDMVQSPRGPTTLVNVFGCLPSPRNLSAMALALLRGNTLVWTPVFHPQRRSVWSKSATHLAMRVFDQVAPRLARLTDGVSAATDEEAAFFARMGAPRVAVVPLPVERTGWRLEGTARREARRSLRLGEGPVVLMVAAHSPRRKGMQFAANVLTLLRQSVPDVKLLLIGGGDPGALGQEPGVVNLGWCTAEVRDLAYASSDVLLVPSLYEQFSRATIEAWANELPVVLTEGVALAPLAAQAGAGLVVTYGEDRATAEAITTLLANAERLRDMGRRGKALVATRNSASNYLA
jgi:glycosyltransferase involved in cell wall biosynthesis